MQAPTHLHAQIAIHLASLDRPRRSIVNLVLRNTGCPRSLYTLARVLRSAQIMDQMAEIDRVNAAYPAIVAKAA